MTPDMPVIKGPAERCAEAITEYLRHGGAVREQTIKELIAHEYDSERREMVRVMEEALEWLEDERPIDRAPLIAKLRAAIAKASKDLTV